MSLAAKEQSLSAFSDPCVFFPLAADPAELEARFGETSQLRKNSRPGFTRKNLASHQGSAWTNSGTALGIEPVLPLEGIRSRCQGKERDAETGNDDFGARYYSNRFGRWLSADWSSVPAPVPYANLSNPQTLNLYAMVSDDPESFADLDGHADDDIVDHILNFVVSAGVTFISDNFFGAGRPQPKSVEGQLGQSVGDFAAQQSGIAEAEAGAAGLASAPETAMVPEVGPEGAALQAVGSQAMVLHGTATAAIATVNLAKAATAPGSRPGKDFTPAGEKAIDARDANKCQNCGRNVESVQNKKGEPTPANQRQRHHVVPKSKGGSGTPENAKTLCPECHKEEHRKMRPKKPNDPSGN